MAKKYFRAGLLFVTGIVFGIVTMVLIGAEGEPPDLYITPPARSPELPFPGPMPGGPQPAGITVSGDFVYVLLGNTVYKLDASDLKVVSQKALGELQGRQPVLPMRQGPR